MEAVPQHEISGGAETPIDQRDHAAAALDEVLGLWSDGAHIYCVLAERQREESRPCGHFESIEVESQY